MEAVVLFFLDDDGLLVVMLNFSSLPVVELPPCIVGGFNAVGGCASSKDSVKNTLIPFLFSFYYLFS